MKIRTTKKHIKALRRKGISFYLIIKDESEEDGNRVLFTPKDEIGFTKLGVTILWADIPITYIPYWRIGEIIVSNL